MAAPMIPGSPSPGAEATPGAGGPAGGSASNTTDYHARLRAGGDWTVQETISQQKRADDAERQLRETRQQLGKLGEVLKGGSWNGDQIADHLTTWQTLRSDPSRSAAIDAIVRGQVPQATVPSPQQDDDYVDPEVKALRQELAAIKGQVQEHTTFAGQQALSRNLDHVAAQWQLSPDQVEKVKGTLAQTITGWAGQPDGERAIRALMSPSGQETVEILAYKALGGFNGLMKVAEANLLRTHDLRHDMATDSPSGMAPRETPPPPVYKTTAEAALQSLRAYRANPEVARGTRA